MSDAATVEAARMDDRETSATDRASLQAALYEFPYHWIPSDARGYWQIWRSLSWGYEYLAVLRTVIELTLPERPTRVLDFGCGDGRLAHELLRAGVGEVVGIDSDAQAIAFASAFNFGERERAHFLCSTQVDERHGRFRVAVAMEVLEHIPDDQVESAVRALAECLDDSGALIVSVPTTNVPLSPKHERHYTIESLDSQLHSFFRIESVRYVHRLGLRSRAIDTLTRNRLLHISEPRVMRLLSASYRRFVLSAERDTAAHLVVRCRRRSRISG